MAYESKPKVCFEVEKVIGISSDGGSYQVQWAPAWVSKFHLEGCQNLVQEFLQRHSLQERPTHAEMPSERNLKNGPTENQSTHSIPDTVNSELNMYKEQKYFEQGGLNEAQPVIVNPVSHEDINKAYFNQPHYDPESVMTEVLVKAEELDESAEMETGLGLSDTTSEQYYDSWNTNCQEECASSEIARRESSHRQNEEIDVFSRTPTCSYPVKGDFSKKSNLRLLRYLYCHLCRKTFSDQNQLVRHLNTHGPKSLSCPHCNYSSSDKGTLKTHLLTHTGVESHSCEVCGRSFSLKSNLKRHLRLHTGEKPYQCSNCGKVFTNVGNRNVHARRCVITLQPTH